MLRRRTILSLLGVGFAIALVNPAGAAIGDVHFGASAFAIKGTVSCNGGPPQSLGNVDEATVDTAGDNIAIASNLSLRACSGLLNPQGIEIYHIGNARDEAIATFTQIEDSAEAMSELDTVSMLGGLVSYSTKLEDSKCTETDSIACVADTTFRDLTFNGQRITGDFEQKTVIPAIAVSVPASACGGLSLGLFTGQLILNESVNSEADHAVQITPVRLKGDLTCVPGGTVHVDLMDAPQINYDLIAGGISVAIIAAVHGLGANLTP